MRHRSARLGALCALGATVAWGTNYSVAKRVLAEIDPLAVAAARAAAGVVVFGLLLLALDGRAAFGMARLRRTLPLGLLGVFANQLLFIEGLKRTSPPHSAILIALLPIHVLVLACLAGQERLTARKTAGVLLAFSGVVLVASESGLRLTSGTLAGDLLTLLGGLAFAGYTVAGRPVLRDLGAIRTTALSFLAGGVGILAVGSRRLAAVDWGGVSGAGIAGLAYVVLAATLLAYLLYYLALDRLEPSKVAAFMYLQPVIAALVAWGVAREPITGHLLAGGALILGGVTLAERG